MSRLIGLVAIVGLGLLMALALLLADRLGEQHRCATVAPTSYAHATYCTPNGAR